MRLEPAPGGHAAVLDAAAICVTRAGVEDYYWPIRQHEIVAAAAAFVETFVSVLRKPLAFGNEDARLFAILSSPLLMNILSLFSASLLAGRSQRDGRSPILPLNGAPEWRAALLGEEIQSFRPLTLLRGGRPRPPMWRRMVRPFADLVRPSRYLRRPIEAANMQKDIVTVTVCPLSRMWMGMRTERVVYVPNYEWFYPPTAGEISADPLKPASASFRDDIIGKLEANFIQLGAEPQRVPKKALEQFLDQTSAWARFYLRRIEANPRRLPRRLWKGSSGVIWSRLLSDAVRCAGGEVTGFDHANGANYSEKSLMPFTELQANDVFVTFTKTQADLYNRIGPPLLLDNRMPRIEHAGDDRTRHDSDMHCAGIATRVPQSIIYVTPYLSYVRTATMPQMTAVMAFDWQARLFTQLQSMGLRVAQKPHPETLLPPAAAFDTEFGIETRRERFEKIMNEYDILLFDFAPQTSFSSALRSGKPIVLIDFGTTSYKPELRQMLERRCAVVSGWFDNENRAQVDSSELREAIKRASSLRDPSFVHEIVGIELATLHQ